MRKIQVISASAVYSTFLLCSELHSSVTKLGVEYLCLLEKTGRESILVIFFMPFTTAETYNKHFLHPNQRPVSPLTLFHATE